MDLREKQGHETTHRHPWELSRARAIERLLRGAGLPARPRLLDVGCGDGWLAQRLGRALDARALMGVDPELDLETRAALRRGAPPLETVTDVADAPPDAFDAALLLDVLEHVERDVDLARQAARCVRRGGQLLLTVPAYPALFSRHDAFLGHHRRYLPRTLAELVAAAGLEPLEQGAWFFSLLLPRAASALLQRVTAEARREASTLRAGLLGWHPRSRGVAGWPHGPALTAPIVLALDVDNRLLSVLARAGLPLPGLSLYARCRRP